MRKILSLLLLTLTLFSCGGNKATSTSDYEEDNDSLVSTRVHRYKGGHTDTSLVYWKEPIYNEVSSKPVCWKIHSKPNCYKIENGVIDMDVVMFCWEMVQNVNNGEEGDTYTYCKCMKGKDLDVIDRTCRLLDTESDSTHIKTSSYKKIEGRTYRIYETHTTTQK